MALSHHMGAWVLGFAVAVAGCGESRFRCATDENCRGIMDGACTPQGFCSMPDDNCPSGRVYAQHSGELSGQCVDEEEGGDEGRDDGAVDATSSSAGDDADVGSTSTGDTGARHEESSSGAIGFDLGVPEDACENGVWDPGETDVDCGGSCEPCPICSGCVIDDDCTSGWCVDATCTTIIPLEVDWKDHCVADMTQVTLDLPSGTWRVRALSSAGSNWHQDGENGGLTWGWRIHCSGFDFGDLRTPVGAPWHATPRAAYGSLLSHEIVREHSGGTISCAHTDPECFDNRGSVRVEFVLVCEGG